MDNKKNRNSFSLLFSKFSKRRRWAGINGTLLWGLLSLFFVILDFGKVSYIENFKNKTSEYTLPLKFNINKILEIPNMISEYFDLKEENDFLKLRLSEAQKKIAVFEGKERELTELKKSLKLKYESNSFEFIEKVLGFDKSIYDSYLLISSTQNNTHKDAVVVSANALVGLVFDSFSNIARVIPVTNQKLSVPVKTTSGEHLILTGTDSKEMVSLEIKSNSVLNLKIGDTLYTSGEGGCYKANIPVAKIKSINKIKNEIKADPIANFDNLSFVWIISPILKK